MNAGLGGPAPGALHGRASGRRPPRPAARARTGGPAARSRRAPPCDDHTPVASPARNAAPSAVVSADHRPLHRHLELVGLHLHEQVVGAGAAVHAQHAPARRAAGSAIRSATSRTSNAIASSVARTRCARVVPAGHAEHRAPRVRIPVRRAQPGQRGHEHHAAGVGHRRAPAPRSARRRPAGRARRAATAPRRRSRTPSPPARRSARRSRPSTPPWTAARPAERTIAVPVLASTNDPVPYVHLASPGEKHAWPNSAACWSPAMPAIGRSRPTNAAGSVRADHPGDGTTSGSARGGTPQQLAQLRRPLPGLDVEQQRPRRVGGVRDVPRGRRSAGRSGRSPPCRPRATRRPRPAHTCGSCSASQVSLVAVKYGSSRSPVSSVTRSSCPASRSRVADPGGPPVLPDDGPPRRGSVRPVPHHRGLPLVGDARDSSPVLARPAWSQGLAAGGQGRLPDVLGQVLHPAGLAGKYWRNSW